MTRLKAYRLAFTLGVGSFAASLVLGVSQVWRERGALPGLPPAVMGAYQRHLAAGELRQAAREHRIASRIDPTIFSNAPELVQAMRRAGDAEGEIEQYRLARARWPRDPATHRALGRTLCHYGRLGEGLASLHEARRLEPRDARTHMALGDAYRQQVRLSEAVDAYGEAARLAPGDPAAHDSLGLALGLAGRHVEAAAAFSAAVQLNPDPVYVQHLEFARAAAARSADTGEGRR